MAALAAGGDAVLTAERLQRLIGEGASALVSFGIAGGLDPALACGDVLLPSAVIAEAGERHVVDDEWHGALCAALRSAATGAVLGAPAIAATAAAKARLFRATAAIAVDLESHVVARAARAAGLPFVVLRVIADVAGRDLPPAALLALDTEGRPVVSAVLRSLLSAPLQLPDLLRLALDTRRALAALRETARRLQTPLRRA